jgi:hypothetical protein
MMHCERGPDNIFDGCGIALDLRPQQKKMCAAGIGFIDVQDFQASTSASPRVTSWMN